MSRTTEQKPTPGGHEHQHSQSHEVLNTNNTKTTNDTTASIHTHIVACSLIQTMSTDDINSALSKVNPQKAAFLVEAWLVHQAIPDVSTLKFIAAIIDLDFEIVRYWFYCRSNRDGIKRAFAQSAAGGSTAGIVLPLLEEYYLLDRFSDDIGWDYQGFDRESQEHEQEPASNSPTKAPQQKRRQQSPPQQQQEQKKSSITALPSDLMKTLNLDNPKQSTSGAETGQSKTTRRRYRGMESSGEDEYNDEHADDTEESDTLGTRPRTYIRAPGGPLKTSGPFKAAVQGSNDKPVRKRGRPLGSFKKKPKLQPTSTAIQPAPAPITQTESQQLSPASLSTFSQSQSTEPPQTNSKRRYLTPVILLPAPSSRRVPSAGSTTNTISLDTTSNVVPSDENSLTAQEIGSSDTSSIRLTEKAASPSSVPTPGLVGDPVAGAESRKKFLELHQSAEAQKRRERNRARSTALPRTRSSKGSNVAPIRAKSASRKRKVIHTSDNNDGDRDDDEDEDAKDGDDSRFTAQDLASSLKNAVDVRKLERVEGPTLGSPPPFFKEYGALVAKRREKQPVQEQPSESTTTNLEIAQSLTPGTVSQQYQSPTAITMAPIDRIMQHSLPLKTTTPTLPAQAHFGEPNLHHHPHNHLPSYFGQNPESRYDSRGSFTVYASGIADYADQQAIELEKIASRRRDMDRRKEEAERHREYDDEQRYKEHRGIGGYRTDRGRSEDEDYSNRSRDRSPGRRRRSDSRGSSRKRDQSAPESRGRSLRPRPLKLRPQTIHAGTIASKSLSHRKVDLQSIVIHADEIPPPQLHTQHQFSRDGSRSPYSPEPIAPALFASTSFLPHKALSHVTSTPHQPQHAQSGRHYPLNDRRHSSRTADTGTYWNTHHLQRVPQGIKPVHDSSINMIKLPTASASFFPSGDGNVISSCNNNKSVDVHEQPRQPSPKGFYNPQPINMEPVHTSRLLPPPSSPSRPSNQHPLFSTIVTPHPNFNSCNQPQNDVIQHDDSRTTRPERHTRTSSGRSIRQFRDDDDGGGNRLTYPSSPSKRSRSQHSNSRRHHTEEHLGSNGNPEHHDRGHRDLNRESDRHSHHGHHDNYSYHRSDHDERSLNGYQRQSHHRSGSHDHHYGYDFEEYEVDTFRRSDDNTRRARDKSLRARSSRRPTSASTNQLSYDHGRGHSRRRVDNRRDRRDHGGSSAHMSSMRDDKHEEFEVEHTMSEWEKRREQERQE
ncbi:hypothetical protein BG015_007594 [Linnemannia schmuckeri]|uniref:Homeobox domain-containing protein n=1 Tax=Linnemannia schmuckeri TaxID=64567 RepID=A0A9P5S6B4_9FUNG|nr:hypothetical protein BG015_007594 [Linnemannia schmuckeri]